jgi:hypothetical protein
VVILYRSGDNLSVPPSRVKKSNFIIPQQADTYVPSWHEFKYSVAEIKLWHPSSSWTMLCTVQTDNFTAADEPQTVTCQFSEISSSTCAMFTPVFGQLGWPVKPSWQMSIWLLLNLLHSHYTPTYTSINWQWILITSVTCFPFKQRTTLPPTFKASSVQYEQTSTYAMNSIHVTVVPSVASYPHYKH